MLTNSSWYVLAGNLFLLAGIILQLWAVSFPRRRGVFCLYTGAVLMTGAALYDRDIILCMGQVLLLPLLSLRVRSKS